MTARKTARETAWETLNQQILACDRCPRLRDYCRQIARDKRAAFRDWPYWGRPVPNQGDSQGRLLIVGLAPAAHGANRTGRMFTGDRSGDWLFRALHKAGFASQPESVSRDDGLKLSDVAITAAVHCAPPDNRPLPDEIHNCQAWLEHTIDLMPARVFLALGQIAWKTIVAETRRRGWHCGSIPRFSHGAKLSLVGGRSILASYHPSQQNTFTGRLTEEMLDTVFRLARQLLDQPE